MNCFHKWCIPIPTKILKDDNYVRENKKENPVSLFIKIGSALIVILSFIALLEEKGLLPQNIFKIIFFISIFLYHSYYFSVFAQHSATVLY